MTKKCEDHLIINLYVHFVSDEQPTMQPKPNYSEKTWRDVLGTPRPNKYSEVRRHIIERCRFDSEFKKFVDDHSRVELCIRLSNEFGWDLDPNSLGKNLNRKH